jgi:hypothetical protein
MPAHEKTSAAEPSWPGESRRDGELTYRELGARRNIWKGNMLTIQARSSILFADPEVFR